MLWSFVLSFFSESHLVTYKKLTFHEIEVPLILRRLLSGALISATLSSIILAPNSQYSSDILDPYEWGVFYRGGDQPIGNSETVKNPRSDQISSLDPLKIHARTKFPFRIIRFTLLLLFQKVSVSSWTSPALISFILQCYSSFALIVLWLSFSTKFAFIFQWLNFMKG